MILPWTVGTTCELPRLSARPRSPWVIYSHDIPMRDISVIYDADIPLNQHFSCLNSWSNTSTSWVQFLTSWGIPMISKLTFPFNHSLYPCKSTFRHTIDFSFQFFKGWMLRHLPVARTLTPVTPQSSRSPVREVLRRTTEKWVDLSWWT